MFLGSAGHVPTLVLPDQSLRAQQDDSMFFEASSCILGACHPAARFGGSSELVVT